MASPLNINELLCEILSYLPLEDLVAACAVCRTWQDVIRGNTRLQSRYWIAQLVSAMLTVEFEQTGHG